MICNKCGKENNEGTKFCTGCGNNISLSENVDNTISNDGDVDKASNNNLNIDNVNNLNDKYVNNVNYSNLDDNGVNNLDTIEKKKHTGLVIALIICLLVVIIGVSAILLWKVTSNKISGNDVNSNNSLNTNNNNNNSSNSTVDTINNNNGSNFNNNTNDNELNDIIFNTQFDNYNIDIDIYMDVNDMSFSTKISGTVDQKNQIEYLKMSMNFMDINTSLETYTDYKNGVTYSSNPLDGSWTKEVGVTQYDDLNGFFEQLKNMNNVEKVDDNHFRVIINKNDFKDILEDNDLDLSSINGDLFADVYTNNGYIEEVSYDFSNLSDAMDNFKYNIKLSNYNNAGDVVIPSEVISGATEY